MSLRVPRSLVLRRGSVLDSYPGLGLGNYLYFALRAFIERTEGARTWVLDSGLGDQWHETLPGLAPFLASPRQAALRRLRYIPERFYQRYGLDYTQTQLEQFVRATILSSRPLSAPAPNLVVNIRRGDYYSVPGLRKLYAFDVPQYVRSAVESATAGARVQWLSVVSDDPVWCEETLPWLKDFTARITFRPQMPGPIGDFWEVTSAPALVLTNSTFSYWAAYASQVLHAAEHRGVWVPAFHQRNIDNGTPWQHDPCWHALPVSPVRD